MEAEGKTNEQRSPAQKIFSINIKTPLFALQMTLTLAKVQIFFNNVTVNMGSSLYRSSSKFLLKEQME